MFGTNVGCWRWLCLVLTFILWDFPLGFDRLVGPVVSYLVFFWHRCLFLTPLSCFSTPLTHWIQFLCVRSLWNLGGDTLTCDGSGNYFPLTECVVNDRFGSSPHTHFNNYLGIWLGIDFGRVKSRLFETRLWSENEKPLSPNNIVSRIYLKCEFDIAFV